MTAAVATKCSIPSPSVLTSQYETLRSSALGEALPPEARAGLLVFLRRGMWGWAHALSTADSRREPNPARSPTFAPTTPCEQRGVVHLFAAMAMNTHDHHRRAP